MSPYWVNSPKNEKKHTITNLRTNQPSPQMQLELRLKVRWPFRIIVACIRCTLPPLYTPNYTAPCTHQFWTSFGAAEERIEGVASCSSSSSSSSSRRTGAVGVVGKTNGYRRGTALFALLSMQENWSGCVKGRGDIEKYISTVSPVLVLYLSEEEQEQEQEVEEQDSTAGGCEEGGGGARRSKRKSEKERKCLQTGLILVLFSGFVRCCFFSFLRLHLLFCCCSSCNRSHFRHMTFFILLFA